MTRVTLQVYHEDRRAGERTRTLVETRHVDTDSTKALTARRAAHIIAREYPAHARVGGALVVRGEDGWRTVSEMIQATRDDRHPIWEQIVLREG